MKTIKNARRWISLFKNESDSDMLHFCAYNALSRFPDIAKEKLYVKQSYRGWKCVEFPGWNNMALLAFGFSSLVMNTWEIWGQTHKGLDKCLSSCITHACRSLQHLAPDTVVSPQNLYCKAQGVNLFLLQPVGCSLGEKLVYVSQQSWPVRAKISN